MRHASCGAVTADATTPILPDEWAHNHRTLLGLVLAEGGLLLVFGLAMAMLVTGTVPVTGGAIAAAGLALLPLPILVAIPLWLDRFEPEPAGLLVRCFLWGAGYSVIVAIIANEATAATLGEWYASSLSAPLVEEAAKGAAVLTVMVRAREHFDGVLDGIVYAFMAALGFAVVEDAAYYLFALYEEGPEAMLETFVARGMLGLLGHPLFTAFIGIGIGIAYRLRSRGGQVAAVGAGYVVAVALHSGWNTAAGIADEFDDLEPLAAMLAINTGLAVLLLLLMVALSRVERRIVRRGLEPELAASRLGDAHLEVVLGTRARIHSWRHARRLGSDATLARRGLILSATQLARFRHREQDALAAGSEPERAREELLVAQLQHNRRIVDAIPGLAAAA